MDVILPLNAQNPEKQLINKYEKNVSGYQSSMKNKGLDPVVGPSHCVGRISQIQVWEAATDRVPRLWYGLEGGYQTLERIS